MSTIKDNPQQLDVLLEEVLQLAAAKRAR